MYQLNSAPPNGGKWDQFPLQRLHYKQIWSQLVPYQLILCRKVLSLSLKEVKYLIVVLQALQIQFLILCYDDSGHQGIDHTLSHLSDITYWVGISRSIVCYCKFCVKCHKAKASLNQPVPLQPVIATQPWELIAVDVLKVTLPTKGNQYLLVIDYFSNWVFTVQSCFNSGGPSPETPF